MAGNDEITDATGDGIYCTYSWFLHTYTGIGVIWQCIQEALDQGIRLHQRTILPVPLHRFQRPESPNSPDPSQTSTNTPTASSSNRDIACACLIGPSSCIDCILDLFLRSRSDSSSSPYRQDPYTLLTASDISSCDPLLNRSALQSWKQGDLLFS